MDIFKDIPKGCKIEKIEEPRKAGTVTMQNVKYSAPYKSKYLELEKKLKQCKNLFSLMSKTNEWQEKVTAIFVIEDPDHILFT